MLLNAQVSFSILMFVSVICLIILTVYVVKLVISVTRLSDSANSIAASVQKDIEPTLSELREAAKSINSIAGNASTGVKNTGDKLNSIFGATSALGGKLKNFSTGILKGIAFGLNLFKK